MSNRYDLALKRKPKKKTKKTDLDPLANLWDKEQPDFSRNPSSSSLAFERAVPVDSDPPALSDQNNISPAGRFCPAVGGRCAGREPDVQALADPVISPPQRIRIPIPYRPPEIQRPRNRHIFSLACFHFLCLFSRFCKFIRTLYGIVVPGKEKITVVWADQLSSTDVDYLREQIEMARADPDFYIIANYQIHVERF